MQMKSPLRIKTAQPEFFRLLEEHASGTLVKNGCEYAASGNWEEDKRTVSGFQALQLEKFFYVHFLPLKSVVWDFPGDPVVENLSVNAGDTGLTLWSEKIPHAAG